MQKLESETIEKILLNLEEKDMLPGERVRLVKKNGKPFLLGKGGFSFVYEAYSDSVPEKHYALKAVVLEDGTKAANDYIHSIEIQKSLQEKCDNVVRIISDGIFPYGENSIAIIIMEKLESIIENDRFTGVKLKRPELSTEDGIISFARDISFALLAASESNILHRDIKLENIFYDEENKRYKLGDFGNAKISKEAGTIIGTKGYVAPEIKNMLSDSYGEEADIYSFGVTLFLLMNGLKFPGSETYHYSRAQYNEGYVFPQCSSLSNSLNDLVRQMCAFEQKYRFSDIYQIHEIFSNFEFYKKQRSFETDAVGLAQEINDGNETAQVIGNGTVQAIGDKTVRASGDITAQAGGDGKAKASCNDSSTRAERLLEMDIIKKDYQVQYIEDFIAAVILSFLSFEGFIPHSKPLPFWNIIMLVLILISAAVFIHKKFKTASLAFATLGIGLLFFDLQNITRHLAFLHKIYDYHIGIIFAALFVFVIASYYNRLEVLSKLELQNK